MPRQTKLHQRYHIKIDGRRTTVSLDYALADLLAARIGADPGSKEAHAGVRAWLQGRSADTKGRGVNRRLIRDAVWAVADKELLKGCAAEVNREAPVAEVVTAPGAAKPIALKRFVLYRAWHGGAPDIISFGETVEEVRERAGEIYAEDEARAAVIRAGLATPGGTEMHGAYYIRPCSEEFYRNAKERKGGIRPWPDKNGVWRTRQELLKMKKNNAWGAVIRSWKEKPLKHG